MSKKIINCSGCKRQIGSRSNINELWNDDKQFVLCDSCYDQLIDYESEYEESSESTNNEYSDSDDEYSDSE